MNLKMLLQSSFNFNNLVLFLIAAFVLIFIDCRDYKEKGLIKEYKMSKIFATFLLIVGIGMYIITRFIIR